MTKLPPERRCFVNGGQIYYGDVIEGKDDAIVRHGQGLQLTKGVTRTGESIRLASYEGAWKNNRMTGSGVYRWSDGSVYEGCFLDGRLHGFGKLSWPEGSVYHGSWCHGEMTGQGRFDNAFDGITTQGCFSRNCSKQHDGTWLDLHSLRQEHHAAWLRIGALGPAVQKEMPVYRCTPDGLNGVVSQVIAQKNLVPFVLADTTCPEQAAPSCDDDPDRIISPAPLWCLEDDPQGCTAESTIYLSFVALEKKRKRDYKQIFRNAIRQALIEYRPFVLVLGDIGGDAIDPTPPPAEWKLPEFFDPFVLPPHLFDLNYFHSSNGIEAFLPEDEASNLCRAADASGPGLGASADKTGEVPEPEENPSSPPVVPVLRFAITSLGRLEAGLTDDDVRKRVGCQFAAHMPLHRMAIIVVQGAS